MDDHYDDEPVGAFPYAGTCDGCGRTVTEEEAEHDDGLCEGPWPDQRLLCEACCHAEAAADAEGIQPPEPDFQPF